MPIKCDAEKSEIRVQYDEFLKESECHGDGIFKASRILASVCHGAAYKAGWWHNKDGTPKERNTGEILMLMVSELAEAMEGDRKGLQDDKLPQYKMFDVELADTIIRIFDCVGAANIPIGEIIAAKLAFNAVRPDHKPENRAKEGGKAY